MLPAEEQNAAEKQNSPLKPVPVKLSQMSAQWGAEPRDTFRFCINFDSRSRLCK
jgi:hypothetical protein